MNPNWNGFSFENLPSIYRHEGNCFQDCNSDEIMLRCMDQMLRCCSCEINRFRQIDSVSHTLKSSYQLQVWISKSLFQLRAAYGSLNSIFRRALESKVMYNYRNHNALITKSDCLLKPSLASSTLIRASFHYYDLVHSDDFFYLINVTLLSFCVFML